MLDRPTLRATQDAGTADAALAYIADELHTALVGFDVVAETSGETAELITVRGRLDRLAAYVADVQTRTAPAHPSLTQQLAAAETGDLATAWESAVRQLHDGTGDAL